MEGSLTKILQASVAAADSESGDICSDIGDGRAKVERTNTHTQTHIPSYEEY